ncbi:hypothetical protein SAMN05216490_0673 [Mucilaginibacter mallensis]|uniref:Uncharacterized protein n=1 Tax=Mucilaginibacter mallensis TaxID=652787 RepID=A0A1H1Q1Z1_MUCMA|nr:hypothetical protein [Mucilaginibacter mallensis]SDS17414.1 hypothetical protein SAMN05216490_0673 [Mucilaginibacter mallensis]
MKKVLLVTPTLLLILFGLILISFQSNTLPNLHGTFAVNYGKKTTAYQQLAIHYTPGGKILFYLEGSTGKPAYNTGSEYGRLSFNKKTGNYEYIPKDTTQDCQLEFVKKGNKIIIKTLHGDCGFGHGVYADGAYQQTSKANPQSFITRTGKKVYFDKTAPEKLTDY